MKYLGEEKLRIEIAIERETIKSIERSISNLQDVKKVHEDRLEYLMMLSANQVIIDFEDEKDMD